MDQLQLIGGGGYQQQKVYVPQPVAPKENPWLSPGAFALYAALVTGIVAPVIKYKLHRLMTVKNVKGAFSSVSKKFKS